MAQSERKFVECQRCGEWVILADRALHQSSLRCRTEAECQSQLRKGNVLAGRYWQVLRSAKVAVKVRSGYKISPDPARWPDQVRDQWWAPAWAFSIASAHFERNDARERDRDEVFAAWLKPTANRVALIQHIVRDLEMQDALLYARGERHDPVPLLRAYAREKGLWKEPDTDN